MGCVIGADVGSQSIKAVVTGDQGRELATASADGVEGAPT
jgi:sugar (pentulose or hexulose) kinase